MPNIFLVKPLFDFVFGCFACNSILILIVTPLVDYIISYNKHVNDFFFEHAKKLEKSAEKTKGVSKKQQANMYNMILYGFCAIYFLNYAVTIWNIRKIPLFSWAFLFQVLSTSFANVPAQGVAHELVHKMNKAKVFLGKSLMAVILYSHFYLEHVYSHHKWVGTPLDAATARRGETLYQFIPRSMSMGYAHAWQYEKERLTSKGISFWSIRHNRMLHYHAIYFCLPAFVFLAFGAKTVLFFLLVAALSICFVETVNYFEHYGLTRKVIGVENGVTKYEPVSIKHSWDAVYRMISWLALNIPLHSDHHAHPLREFYELQMHMEAPMMPYTYSIMFVLSYSPSTFMGIMHPLLDKLQEQEDKLSKEKELDYCK